MHIIKSAADIKNIKRGDSYLIDVFPPADKEDQTVTEKMLAEEQRLQRLIDKRLKQLTRA
jgi:hypothetical protein